MYTLKLFTDKSAYMAGLYFASFNTDDDVMLKRMVDKFKAKGYALEVSRVGWAINLTYNVNNC